MPINPTLVDSISVSFKSINRNTHQEISSTDESFLINNNRFVGIDIKLRLHSPFVSVKKAILKVYLPIFTNRETFYFKKANDEYYATSGIVSCFEYVNSTSDCYIQVDVTDLLVNSSEEEIKLILDSDGVRISSVYNQNSATYYPRFEFEFNDDFSIYNKGIKAPIEIAKSLANSTISLDHLFGKSRYLYLLNTYENEKFSFPLFLVWDEINARTAYFNNLSTGLPLGFKTNLHQAIYESSESLYYIDELYRVHKFIKSVNNDNIYHDLNGTYKIIQKSQNNTYELIDSNLNSLIFNSNGLLSIYRLRNGDNYHSIFISYDNSSARILNITDTILIDIYFIYDQQNKLTQISFNGYKNNIIIECNSNNCLTKIIDGSAITRLNYETKIHRFFDFFLLNEISTNELKLKLSYDNRFRVNKISTISNGLDENILETQLLKYGYKYLEIDNKPYNNSLLSLSRRYVFDEDGDCIIESNLENNILENNKIVNKTNSTNENIYLTGLPISCTDEFYASLNVTTRELTPELSENIDYIMLIQLEKLTCFCAYNESATIELQIIEDRLISEDEIESEILNTLTIEANNINLQKVFYIKFKPHLNHGQNHLFNKLYLRIFKLDTINELHVSNLKIYSGNSCSISLKCSNIQCSNPIPEEIDSIASYFLLDEHLYLTYTYNSESFAFNKLITYDDFIFSIIFSKFFYRNIIFTNSGKQLHYNVSVLRFCFNLSGEQYSFSNIILAKISKFSTGEDRFFSSIKNFYINGSNLKSSTSTKLGLNRQTFTQTSSQILDSPLKIIEEIGVEEDIKSYSYNFDGLLTTSIEIQENNQIYSEQEYGINYDIVLNKSVIETTSIEERSTYEKNLIIEHRKADNDPISYLYDNERRMLQTLDGTSSNFIEYDNANISSIYDDRYFVNNIKNVSYFYDNFGRIKTVKLFNNVALDIDEGYEGNLFKKVLNYGSYTQTIYRNKYGQIVRILNDDGTYIEYFYDLNSFVNGCPILFRKENHCELYVGCSYYGYNLDGSLSLINDDAYKLEIINDDGIDERSHYNGVQTNLYKNIISMVDPYIIEKQFESINNLTNHKQIYKKTLLCDQFGNVTSLITHQKHHEFNSIWSSYITVENSERYFKQTYELYDDNISPINDGKSKFIKEEKYISKSIFVGQPEQLIFNSNYFYDNSGRLNRIMSLIDGFEVNHIFDYDSKNRLVRYVSNTACFEYIYNNLGDIISKTNGSSIINYQYDSLGRLISYGNFSFEYDNLGYPTLYKNKEVSFERNCLKMYGNVQLGYDLDNNLTSIKVLGIETTKIDIFNKKIVSVTKNINNQIHEMVFIYGVNNEIIGFKYNNEDYFLIKNILGDVIAIHNSSGNIICHYEYDAFGNMEVYDSFNHINEDDDFIGNMFPIRYRGYFYVVETGLFMMGHRFYDPEIGRFISPDDVEYLDPTKINGLNLYAYCNNDPINYADPDGHAPQWLQIAGWIGLGVGAALCIAAVGILAAGVSTATLIGAIAVGAAKGALIGAGIGVGVGAIAGGAGAMISGEEFGSSEFWSDVGFGAMTGFGAGAVIGAVSGGFAGANGWYNAKALEFTNYGSSEVYLGKDPSYFTIAQQNGGTSFHVSSEIWNSTANMKGVNMWRINKAFLKQQIALGNRFVFTSYNITGMYAREVAYVLSLGIWAFLW